MRPTPLAVFGFFLATAVGPPAWAGVPLDLDDPTPRSVRVEIDEEIEDLVAQGGSFGLPLIGSFSSDDSVATVTVPGAAVEARITQLFGGFVDPVADSFSDYVIRIDVATREVLSAEVSGSVDAPFVGVLDIAQTASSTQVSGFFLNVFAGFELPFFCSGGTCTLVPGADYDPATGMARAVGLIGAGALNFFTPFGDIRLTELQPLECDTAVSSQQASVGEPVLVSLAIRSNGATDEPVELKVYYWSPDGGVGSLVNVGSNGAVVVPAGAEIVFSAASLFTVNQLSPQGTAGVGCRLLDPVTGETLAEDRDAYEVGGL